MAEAKKDGLTPEQIAMANHVNLRALEALLIKKNIISAGELHAEVKRVFEEMTGGQ